MASSIHPSPTVTPSSSSTSTPAHEASPSCTTAVPDQYGYVPPSACNANYAFYPNFAGNAAFAVLFGLTTLVHVAQAFAHKKRFCWVIIMGATWECLSFSFRAAGARDQQQIGWPIAATLLLLLAPLWINAFVYMVVARLVHYILPDQRVWGIKATWLTRMFVGLDILTFLVQAVGGSMMSNQEPDGKDIVRKGQQAYMVGIGIQGAFIVIFGAMTASFYVSMRREAKDGRDTKRARILVWIMFTVLTLIMVRIIFRLCEFGPGVNLENPILTDENYTFVLDGFPMLLALLLLNALHPGTVLRGPDSEFPSLTRKEKKTLKREKKAQKAMQKEEKKRRKQKVNADSDDGDIC